MPASRAYSSSSRGAACPGGPRGQPRCSPPGVWGWFQGDLSEKKICDGRTHTGHRTDRRDSPNSYVDLVFLLNAEPGIPILKCLYSLCHLSIVVHFSHEMSKLEGHWRALKILIGESNWWYLLPSFIFSSDIDNGKLGSSWQKPRFFNFQKIAFYKSSMLVSMQPFKSQSHLFFILTNLNKM